MKKIFFYSFLLTFLFVSCKKDNPVESQFKNADITMIPVVGGSFMMGDNFGGGISDEKPLHKDSISSFKISRTEVTQKQWRDLMGYNPSQFTGSGDDAPVEMVSWTDCLRFCNKLSLKNSKTPCYSIWGITDPNDTCWTRDTLTISKIMWDTLANGYRLPSEAEWEFAARAGIIKDTLLVRDTTLGGQLFKYSGTSDNSQLSNYGWFSTNSDGKTHGVGEKTSNSFGLFDMSGNVREWCWDWYGGYGGVSQINPVGPATGVAKVFRGGSWWDYAGGCRTAVRFYVNPANKYNLVGFRIAQK